MTCLAALSPDTVPDDPAALAARLSGVAVAVVERVAGGGNNRLYRVEAETGRYALKCYDGNGDARLAREFEGLAFLAAGGVACVPRPEAADQGARAALYEWVEGVPAGRAPAERRPGDAAAAVGFVRRLAGLGDAPGAKRLARATEACLSAAELAAQIDRRIGRLSQVAGEPALAGLLDGVRAVRADALAGLERRYRDAGLDPAAEIAPGLRCLSPSDFGFHNALRRADGSLVFLDFEYFGWDDPVKLVADFLWHPGFTLSAAERQTWTEGTAAVFGADPGFAVRLAAQAPLYGLRWTLILLNEFLPERWQRRVFAGTAAGWAEAKAVQLGKARAWLSEAARLAASRDPLPLPADR